MLSQLPKTLRFGLQDLINLIRETNPSINLSLWGKGDAKTATHLIDEVNNGECTLELINGVLYRNIEVVSITITYPSQDGLLHLQEKEQIFTDGRSRARELPDQCSVAEKMKIGKETPLEAALRAFKEELNLVINSDQLHFIITLKEIRPSSSYPGITNSQITHVFECSLLEDQFNPRGYTEIQDDKKTHFHWVPIPSQPV